MIVFICLSKGGKTQICNDDVGQDFDDTDNVSGLRSYGKVVYVFGTLPIIGFVVFACKILALFPLVGCFDWLAICINILVFGFSFLFCPRSHSSLGSTIRTGPSSSTTKM